MNAELLRLPDRLLFTISILEMPVESARVAQLLRLAKSVALQLTPTHAQKKGRSARAVSCRPLQAASALVALLL